MIFARFFDDFRPIPAIWEIFNALFFKMRRVLSVVVMGFVGTV